MHSTSDGDAECSESILLSSVIDSPSFFEFLLRLHSKHWYWRKQHVSVFCSWGWKSIFFNQLDYQFETAHPAIMSFFLARQQNGCQFVNTCWMDLMMLTACEPPPIPYLLCFPCSFPCLCLWPDELNLLTCCSHCLPRCWAYISFSSAIFLAASLAGVLTHACTLGAPGSAGYSWRRWIRETWTPLQDPFFSCSLRVTSPSSRLSPPACLCHW